ncbi:MAG: hypothetical protein R6X02_11520 [Enhygromyxa sp.]
MLRWLAGVSMVLALAACSPVTIGTGDDIADEESGSGGVMESGEGAAEQGGEGEGEGDSGCQIGAEGCPCTVGGGCDPGLTCDLGICVPGSSGDGDGDPTTGDGDGDPTTGDGDGDPTTGDGDGDGDPNPNFMCVLDDWCDEYDPQNCVCEGCNTNGYCSDDEDCVCPDCSDLPECKGSNCYDGGLCHPYWEGCECADCAGHPLCS